MSYNFKFDALLRYMPEIAQGVLLTLQFSVVTMVCGLAIGLLRCHGRHQPTHAAPRLPPASMSRRSATRRCWSSSSSSSSACPRIGIRLDAKTAALIALSINMGAYAAEILRAGFEVRAPQPDRGRALAGADRRADLPPCRALPGGQGDLSGAGQPVRPDHAGHQRRLLDRRDRTLPPGRLHRLAHLPLLRDLHPDHRVLPGAHAWASAPSSRPSTGRSSCRRPRR